MPAAKVAKVAPDCQVEPLSFEYSNVPAPPAGDDTTIEPVDVPKQVALVGVTVALNTVGWVIDTPVVEVQLFASLTVIVYDPAAKVEKVVPELKFVPSLENVYGEVPPVADTVTDPALAPKHILLL